MTETVERELNVLPLPARSTAQMMARFRSAGFERWSSQLLACGACAHPVRLAGGSTTVDTRTGEVVARYDTRSEPDGVAYVRCGNRRASRCPSCSREYQGDMWHLIVAGAAGGKGVPDTVAAHPLVFATLTAPSFGPVHTHKHPGRAGSRRCRPRGRKELCRHGKPTWCMAVHDPGDHDVGSPLCPDCYDYLGQVVWQWHAPELWRRFAIALRRQLAAHLDVSEQAGRRLVRVQFAKVAEFQRRGVIHFHALIRLDGPATADDPYPAPRVHVPAETLAELNRATAASVRVDAPPAVPGDSVRVLRFGTQVDARPVHSTQLDGVLGAEAVAGYIAKYATKATEDVDPGLARSDHVQQLRATIERIVAASATAGDPDGPYERLRLWQQMLGFRGHFATKSRAYSTTLTHLRHARRVWRRRKAHPGTGPVADTAAQLADDAQDETTVIIGSWRFAGMDWLTDGDAALAAMAADAARDYAKQKAHHRRTQRTDQNQASSR